MFKSIWSKISYIQINKIRLVRQIGGGKERRVSCNQPFNIQIRGKYEYHTEMDRKIQTIQANAQAYNKYNSGKTHN